MFEFVFVCLICVCLCVLYVMCVCVCVCVDELRRVFPRRKGRNISVIDGTVSTPLANIHRMDTWGRQTKKKGKKKGRKQRWEAAQVSLDTEKLAATRVRREEVGREKNNNNKESNSRQVWVREVSHVNKVRAGVMRFSVSVFFLWIIFCIFLLSFIL